MEWEARQVLMRVAGSRGHASVAQENGWQWLSSQADCRESGTGENNVAAAENQLCPSTLPEEREREMSQR